MEQAIGRVCRPGQEKDVYVYHLLAEDTADISVTEQWEAKLVVHTNEAILVPAKRKGHVHLAPPEERHVRKKIK